MVRSTSAPSGSGQLRIAPHNAGRAWFTLIVAIFHPEFTGVAACRHQRPDGGRAVDVGLIIAIGCALSFALTNGFHDASNAIATLVATGATPGQAVALSAVFNMAGAVLLGTAVADTIGTIVTVPQSQVLAVVGSGLAGATGWNLLTWWLGLPSSSGHALVGGLAGSAVAEGALSGDGGLASVRWGGFEGWHPTGVFGVLIALLISPVLGFAFAFLIVRFVRRISRRWTTRWNGPVRGAGWVAAAGLSFSHGGNDATEGDGRDRGPAAGRRAHQRADGAAVGEGRHGPGAHRRYRAGWLADRTDRRPAHLQPHPIDSVSSQTSSTAVILGASLIGAPVSTTQVVASSVVGVGAGRRRWQHVRWEIVREMGLAWLTTIPAAALLAVGVLLIWRTAL